MTSDDAFLAAICAEPENMAPRQMYADWLIERGDPRGECIRDALADPHGAQYTASADMARHYRPLAGWDGWPAGVTWTVQIRRGFVEWVSCDAADWLAHGPALVRIAPLRRASLRDMRPSRAYVESEGREVFCWWKPGNGPLGGSEVPWPLWCVLASERRISLGIELPQATVKDYPTEGSAEADLSRVALAWARTEALAADTLAAMRTARLT